MQQKTYFDSVLEQLFELPLWVKQAMYAELRDHIRAQSPMCSLETISKHNLIQLYTPFITQNGIKVASGESTSFNVDKSRVTVDMLALLKCAANRNRIIDICQKNNWNLTKTSQMIVDCIELNLLEPITSSNISSTLYFIAGKIRIGEYLVRTGKISVEQLDMALYSQKYTENSLGERIFLAQILLNMSYITPDDYENIIFLKDYGNELYSNSFNDNISDMSSNVNNLKEEVILLRNERLKLRKNLAHASEDAQTIAKLLEQIDNLKDNLSKIKSEHENAQRDLNMYLDELVSLSQENVELKEKLDNTR